MSQFLNPVSGGVVQQVQTTTTTPRLNVLSPQYIRANNLGSRPTEWIPEGRPIYRRLPAISETYQIDFYNVVAESNISSNSLNVTGIADIGYSFVPYGDSIDGATSMQVVSSENNQNLLVKAGYIVWKYGKTQVLPTIANLQILEVTSGKYDIAYQLLYDDSPQQNFYEVEDFALTGQPLNITSSTDSVTGWRYPAVNAFLNTSSQFWSNEDSYFPSSVQPIESYLQWSSELAQSYSKITLRLPSGAAYTGTATLSYADGSNLSTVMTTGVVSDSSGLYFEFNVESPVFQTGWNVSFSSSTVSIQSITVSGMLTLLTPMSAPSPRAVLVMYPTGTLPQTTTNGEGQEIPATYCHLAQVDVNTAYEVTKIQDTRSIIHRDYVPVANWLTLPFDQDLTDMYLQVLHYPDLWMAPPTALKQEYAELSSSQVTVGV